MLENIFNIDLFWAFVILVVSIIFAKLISFIFEKITRRIIGKTSTILDDEIIKALEKPILWLIIIIGLYFSLRYLDFLYSYNNCIFCYWSFLDSIYSKQNNKCSLQLVFK